MLTCNLDNYAAAKLLNNNIIMFKVLNQLLLLHCPLGYLFFEFSNFWIREEPESVMEFNRVRDKFADNITELLKDPNTVLELKYNYSCDEASLSSVSTLNAE